jgi:phospholipase/lecithinase/hemolysin
MHMPFANKIRPCAIFACMALIVVAAHAATPKYDAIFVFGDSLCDVGNIYIYTKGAAPPPPYYDGRFSNGPIWVDHLASSLGLPMLPALKSGGTNYAIGGAWVTAPVVTPEGTILDVTQQVETYLTDHKGKADPKALYILEGGGNDILGAIANGGGSASALGAEIATDLSNNVATLRKAGAEHFLVTNLLNVAAAPAAAANRSFASAATIAANTTLTKLLGSEASSVLLLDEYTISLAIGADKYHFGFTNVTTPCLSSTNKVCSDPDHTFFWDTVHPTEFGHSILATNAITALIQ